MSSPAGRRSGPLGAQVTVEVVAPFASLVGQLAAQMAEESLRSITAAPGWTMAQVETEHAIERMEINSRDLLTAKGSDPDGENWRTIWTAMESCYRQTMMDLLRVSGLRVGEKLQ